jgi:two-component system chemotaxis response regulator CheY
MQSRWKFNEGGVSMSSKLILVADDAAFMRKLIRMTLAETGLTDIVEASDGDEAVTIYKEKHPDLVLLDITMVRKNGLEALQEIMDYDPMAKVIMCSAIGQEQTVMSALTIGAVDYVVKPFEKDKLIETVQGLL